MLVAHFSDLLDNMHLLIDFVTVSLLVKHQHLHSVLCYL